MKEKLGILNDSQFYLKSTINSVQFKADIAMNEIEMSRLRQIAADAKKFHSTLEHIELLKMEHVESAELTLRVNELFTAFNSLCVRNNLFY